MNGGIYMYFSDPNDFSGSDSERIQQAVYKAKETGTNKIVIPPYNNERKENKWVIDKAIELPSDITVLIDNAYMVLADDVYSNMFINENLRKPEGRKMSGIQKNIVIEGQGHAVLDGGNYNGLCEGNSTKDGLPHVSFNNMILFSGVDGFQIKNIKVKNQRWWALDFLYCRNGYIGNIDFEADFTWCWPDGTRREAVPENESYDRIYIKNADGIDLRCGCSNIIIENITGYTEDDSIALTAMNGSTEKLYGVTDADDADIHNVIIRNVMTKTACANVRLLNQGGPKLYNILIDGVFDGSKDGKYRDNIKALGRGHGVRIGDRRNYGGDKSKPEDTYNITVRNVVSRSETALEIVGGLSDSFIENIKRFDCENDYGRCDYSAAELVNVIINE